MNELAAGMQMLQMMMNGNSNKNGYRNEDHPVPQDDPNEIDQVPSLN